MGAGDAPRPTSALHALALVSAGQGRWFLGVLAGLACPLLGFAPVHLRHEGAVPWGGGGPGRALRFTVTQLQSDCTSPTPGDKLGGVPAGLAPPPRCCLRRFAGQWGPRLEASQPVFHLWFSLAGCMRWPL